MQDVIEIVIASVVMMIMFGFTIYAIYSLYTKCCKSIKYNYNIKQVSTKSQTPQIIENINCDDIKLTTITISQHQQQINEALEHHSEPQLIRHNLIPARYQMRQRSMSDPDLLADSVVTVAIESQSPVKSHRSMSSPFNNRALTPPSHHSMESTESIRTDEDFDQSVSPLSTPKVNRNPSTSQHQRSHVNTLQVHEVSELMQDSEIQRLIHSQTLPLDDTLDQLIDDMADIVDQIDETDNERMEENSDAASNNQNQEDEEEMGMLQYELEETVSAPTMIVEDDRDGDNDKKEAEIIADEYYKQNQEQIVSRTNPYMSHKINSSSASSGTSLSAAAITRLIIGDPDVRIEHDDSRSSASIPSDTNFSYSTPLSQYSGFMNLNKQNPNQNKAKQDKNKHKDKDKGKNIKIKVESIDFDQNKENVNENEAKLNKYQNHDDNGNEDEEEEEESRTITYDNSNEDYNCLHGIKAVPSRHSLNGDGAQKSVKIELEQKDESPAVDKREDEDIQDEADRDKITPINCDVKQKISEYKKNIKNLEENSGKLRRQSVNILKKNRVVKSKRDLFENNDIKK